MKKIIKKIFLVVMILIIINNIFIACSYAISGDDVLETFAGILGGVVGILTWPMRMLALLAGKLLDKFTALVAYTEGATDSSIDTSTITPFDIFFNKVKLLDINFFEIESDSNFIKTMRTSVASWYYVLRVIASAILLVILVYVGIRMAISTVASDKAAYKKMLVDWVCSLALVFLLHYVIIFAINVNTSIVKVIETSVSNTNVSNTYKEIRKMSRGIDLTAIGATIVYCMLVWQTLGLVVSYFNRMLKVAFLIIISPLVTITYSIDKMGDGKAQALNIWLKEIVFTILIQPFHCVIYMCLVDTAFKLLVQPSEPIDKLARGLVAVLMIRFVKEGEKIIRKIFAFKDDNSKTSVATALATTGIMLNQAKNFGKTARNVGRGAVNLGKGVANFKNNAVIETAALISTVKNRGKDGNSFAANKEKAKIHRDNKKAEKIAKRKKYKVAGTSTAAIATAAALRDEFSILQSDIDKEKENVKAQHDGAISDEAAEAEARLNLVKKKRKDNRIVNKKIKKAKGYIEKAGNKFSKIAPGTSEALAVVKDMGKDYLKISAAGGMGLFTGSGLYGTGKDLFSSVAIGTAVGTGIYGLTKKTKATLSNNIKQYMDNLGVNGEDAFRAEMSNVLNDKDKFGTGEEANKERQDIIKELQAALAEFGVDEASRTAISNQITSDLQNNPATAPDSIAHALGKLNYKDPKTGKSQSFEESPISKNDAVTKLMQYSNRNAIYNEIQTAKEIDISSGELTEKTAELYSNELAAFSNVDEVYEKIRIKDNNDVNGKVNETTRLDEAEITRLNEKYEEEINRIEAERKVSGITNDQMDELDKLIEEAKKEQEDVLIKALEQRGNELNDINKKILADLKEREVKRKKGEEV